jgi:hypothetical protein
MKLPAHVQTIQEAIDAEPDRDPAEVVAKQGIAVLLVENDGWDWTPPLGYERQPTKKLDRIRNVRRLFPGAHALFRSPVEFGAQTKAVRFVIDPETRRIEVAPTIMGRRPTSPTPPTTAATTPVPEPTQVKAPKAASLRKLHTTLEKAKRREAAIDKKIAATKATLEKNEAETIELKARRRDILADAHLSGGAVNQDERAIIEERLATIAVEDEACEAALDSLNADRADARGKTEAAQDDYNDAMRDFLCARASEVEKRIVELATNISLKASRLRSIGKLIERYRSSSNRHFPQRDHADKVDKALRAFPPSLVPPQKLPIKLGTLAALEAEIAEIVGGTKEESIL